MTVSTPTTDQIAEIAAELGMNLTEADVASFQGLMGAYVEHYPIVEKLPDALPEVTYPRTIGTRPAPEGNPLNAWHYKSTVTGAETGKLAGKTVVLKDNVMLAGVPMMNGSSTLEGYIPDIDATIVTRMLDEGAVIAGKAHCELFCLSGGSHTNATGPVHNPHKPGDSAG